MLSWPQAKDPDDIADYQMNWSERLEDGETIDTSVFSVTQGTVEIDSQSLNGGLTTVWLSGGAAGEVCLIRNRVVTDQGRQWDATGRLRIREN
jgi:hypothetical protein